MITEMTDKIAPICNIYSFWFASLFSMFMISDFDILFVDMQSYLHYKSRHLYVI